MVSGVLSVVACIAVLCCSSYAQSGKNFLVALPRELQCCKHEKVLVSVFKVAGNQIPTKLQVLDSDSKVIVETAAQQVGEGSPAEFTLSIPCNDLPKSRDPTVQRVVSVRAVGTSGYYSFSHTKRVAVKSSPSLVLIQTDKPIYLENDEVHIRVAVLGCNFAPCCSGNDKCVCDVILDIKNPQDIVVDRLVIKPCASNGAIKRRDFKLGPAPIEGDWAIIARRSCDDSVISETGFEVKNFVLPRFDVNLVPPKYVRPGDADIEIDVIARYTYGKGVVGLLDVKIGICNDSSTTAMVFKHERFYFLSADRGRKLLTFPNAGYDEFPVNQRLCIFAEVTERASGIKFGKSDNSAHFTDNPIKIDCELTPPFYRANLPLQLQIRARYPNGELVENVEVQATQPDGTVKRQTTGRTGVADVSVDIGNTHGDLQILVAKTGQVGVRCGFKEFCSACGGQITVRPKVLGKQQVGATADFEIIKAQSDNRQLPITAIVVARGTIQSSQHFNSQAGPVTTFQVPVVPQLANRFCVLVYYVETCDEVIADVACVETDKACANEISLHLHDQDVQPGRRTAIDINVDCPNSDVALLAVDKGLYLLNNENRLSRDKLFQALDNCSSSCGNTVASSDGIFDSVGLTGISGTRLNPQCDCSCQGSCKNACLLPDKQCAAGRRKRDSEMTSTGMLADSNIYVKMVAACKEVKAQASQQEDRFAFCRQKYADVISGKLVIPDNSEEGALYIRSCCLGDLRARANVPSEFNDIVQNEDPNLIKRRTYFPHVWLQDEDISNGDKNQITKHVVVPDSITEWSIYGLAQCCATGFCVSEPVSLRVFKPLFVECHLPYALKRQEQVSIACTAYNYNNFEQKACLKVIRPPENLCTSAGAGEETAHVCFKIASYNTQTILIPVLPLEVGTTELTVRMITEFGGDEIVKSIRVVPEGIMRDYDYRAELDPEGVNMNVSGGCTLEPPADLRRGRCFKSVSRGGECVDPIEGDYTKEECCLGQVGSYSLAWSDGNGCEVCTGRNESHLCGTQCPCSGKAYNRVQVNYFYVRAPEDYIEGSETAWLGVSGNYFSVEEEIEGKVDPQQGIEGILRRPSGCGEQSMLKFGPNCAIVAFLAATNPGAEAPHLPLLRDGYNYQLRYRKADSGGFCVWQHHAASTWLSSFVLRTMCCARDFIAVDKNVVSGLIDFLETRQDASGKVLEPKTVYHREMVGGVQEGGVSMTAYTSNSMMECCSVADKPELVGPVCKAVGYMLKEVRDGRVTRPYAQAIVYLTLVKACNYSKCGLCRTEGVCDFAVIAKLRNDLFEKVVIGDDGSMHWEADTTVGQAYWYRRKPQAISVEMTSYVLEACLVVNDCQCAGSAAKWLNSVRNSRGGLVSTQDTVVALNALSKFAAGCRITTRHPPNLCVKVTRMSNPDEVFTNFSLTQSNARLTQRVQVPINDVYKVETCGTGLGQAMVHVEYNVPATGIEQCAFNLTVAAKEVQLNNVLEESEGAEIAYCVRYLGDGCTSMAIVEVELPTGYEPCDHIADDSEDLLCLRDILLGMGPDLKFTKYEITGKSVVFYFDTLCNNKEICITFKAYKKYEVMHSLPVSIQAYDYYEPDLQCTDFYTLGGGSPELGLICDDRNKKSPTCVCGAGRCPKLDQIYNRLCNACVHHHYVYKVKVVKVNYTNGWFKYKVEVIEILKPGRVQLKAGDRINLWLPAICKLEIDLNVDKTYHIQGRDGNKFVLDHNAHVEEWPRITAKECRQHERDQCIKRPCRKHETNKARRACERKRKVKCVERVDKACAHLLPFEDYVRKLKEGGHCELHNICD